MRFLFTLLVACSFSSFAQAQSFSSPLEYIEYFNQEFRHMQELQIEYSSFLVHTRSDVAEAKRQALLASTQKTHNRFAHLKAYENDKGIKENATKALDQMLEIGNKDYAKLSFDKAGCIDCFASVLAETELTDKDTDKLGKTMKAMIKSIEDFAKANNIRMEDANANHESLLGKINRINGYIRELDLATLEVQYADEAIVKALNDKNPSKAKEEIKNMVKAATNANKRLKKVERIKEDATAFGQAERLVAFFKDAAKELYPDMVSAFDKKGNILNDKVKLYNKTIEKLSRGGNNANVKYQTAKANLQLRHIPKPGEQETRS